MGIPVIEENGSPDDFRAKNRRNFSLRVSIVIGPEDFRRDPRDQSSRDQTLTLSAEVIPESRNVVALARCQSPKAVPRNDFRRLFSSFGVRGMPSNFVKFGCREIGRASCRERV